MSKQVISGTGIPTPQAFILIDNMFDELYNSIQIVKTSQLENDANFISSDDDLEINQSSVSGLITDLNTIQSNIDSNKSEIDNRINVIVSQINELRELYNSVSRNFLSINLTISKFNSRILALENAPTNTPLE